MTATRSCFVALLLILMAGSNALAQHNVLKVDALGYIRNRVFVGYERTFFKQASFGLAYENMEYASEDLSGGGEYDLRAKGIVPELRYYPFHKRKTAPLGFFAGAGFRYAWLTESHTPSNTEIKGTVFNYGLISGYKFHYKRLVGEALVGYGTGSISPDFEDASRAAFRSLSEEKYQDEIRQNLRMELSIGFVFPKIRTKTSGKY